MVKIDGVSVGKMDGSGLRQTEVLLKIDGWVRWMEVFKTDGGSVGKMDGGSGLR